MYSYIRIKGAAMTSPATIALGLAITLAVLPTLTSPFESRLLRSDPKTGAKLCYYALTISSLWGFTAVAVWLWGTQPLLDAPGPLAAWMPFAPIAGPVIGVLTGAYLLLAFSPLIQSLRGTRRRAAVAKALRRHAAKFPGLLPNNGAERLGFVLISLTAGICEETLYRGFMIRFLHEGPAALPIAAALAASSLFFGLGHIYQGVGGVIRTGLAGAVFGLLFLVTGSLIPGIVLHALVDLQVAYALRPLPEDAEAAAAA
jgi:membrane protease YdiL (CAAX protease family)